MTELEAIQRKAFIDFLQKNKRYTEILKAVIDYKRTRAIEKAARTVDDSESEPSTGSSVTNEDNTYKTYREFIQKFIPFYARKNRFSPNTFDSYTGNLKNHILPYFGDRVMSTITSEDIDNFLDHLSKKPCKGSKSYGKKGTDIPKLSSGTIKKCYNILMVGFPTAKKWRYVTEIPDTTAPVEKYKRRKAWDPETVYSALVGIEADKLLHLAIHFAFVCSLRAGETAGLDLRTLDFHDRSIWITQEVQRVSDKALHELPKEEIFRIFPKQLTTSKSSVILKGPKTERSYRKLYLTTPLLSEIKERLDEIKSNKEFFGKEYKDYGLLICHPDGRPIDPKSLDKAFKDWQKASQIENLIEFQGLRKSGQMHKIRITHNNYQLAADAAGNTAPVTMTHYDEVLDSEKRALSQEVEKSFYPKQAPDAQLDGDAETLLQKMQKDPELLKQVVQIYRSSAVGVN
jgi:integrase